MLGFLRVPCYEVYIRLHGLVATCLVILLWQHLSISPFFSRFYIIIAAGVFASTTLLRFLRILFRHAAHGSFHSSTKVVGIPSSRDTYYLKIQMPRPWTVRAGQYFFIWIPFCSFWSLFQSHPFTVAWWDEEPDGSILQVYTIVQAHAGFTRKLIRHTDAQALWTWVDGPYGTAVEIGEYGNVLMFASGIGIAAQVPYVKEHLKGLKAHTVRTRSAILVWQLEHEGTSHFSHVFVGN